MMKMVEQKSKHFLARSDTYTTMGILWNDLLRKYHPHHSTCDGELEDDQIEVKIHDVKLLCMNSPPVTHIVCEEEGD